MVAIALAAGWNIIQNKSEISLTDDLILNSVESIAACEVSSNASGNSGYCSTLYGGGGDSCVSSGSGSEPRCSGNM
jgi:hypothetical protein